MKKDLDIHFKNKVMQFHNEENLHYIMNAPAPTLNEGISYQALYFMGAVRAGIVPK
jgi:hypothetical protein